MALREVAGAAASQEHRLGQQRVIRSSSFQGQLGQCLQAVNVSAGFAVGVSGRIVTLVLV